MYIRVSESSYVGIEKYLYMFVLYSRYVLLRIELFVEKGIIVFTVVIGLKMSGFVQNKFWSDPGKKGFVCGGSVFISGLNDGKANGTSQEQPYQIDFVFIYTCQMKKSGPHTNFFFFFFFWFIRNHCGWLDSRIFQAYPERVGRASCAQTNFHQMAFNLRSINFMETLKSSHLRTYFLLYNTRFRQLNIGNDLCPQSYPSPFKVGKITICIHLVAGVGVYFLSVVAVGVQVELKIQNFNTQKNCCIRC